MVSDASSRHNILFDSKLALQPFQQDVRLQVIGSRDQVQERHRAETARRLQS